MGIHQCKDCGKNCDVDRDKRHMDTWKRSKRCFYCQLDFEILLKSKPIGKQGLTKWHFWVHLQELQRWDSRWKEIEHWVLQTSDEEKRLWDTKVANALANSNIDTNNVKL